MNGTMEYEPMCYEEVRYLPDDFLESHGENMYLCAE